MKKMTAILFLLCAQTVSAAISGSVYEVRHLDVIENSIVNKCGRFLSLNQVASKEEVIKVDQGIRDIEFKTTIEGVQRFDQFLDKYEITVESKYVDAYDHNSKEQGSYKVSEVDCKML